MGTTVQSLLASRSTQDHHPLPQLQWLNLVLRRRRLTPSTSPSMSMTSREMARLMPSTLVTSSEPATSTPPSRPSLRSENRGQGTEDVDQGRCLPHVQGLQGQQGPGGFHDFVEILKLYDKNDDNTMLAHELFRLLTNLGEKLTKEEAKSLMKE